MIVMQWQIDQARATALLKNPHTLVGMQVDYEFCHATAPSVNNGICGLYGFILKVTEGDPDQSHTQVPIEGRQLTLDIAFETSMVREIGDFYVTQENLAVVISPEQLLSDALTVMEAANYEEIFRTIHHRDP
jgi:hypothetical protein